MEPLRIGTLGAAAITPAALIAPARALAEAEVVAVAARDPARARSFADQHGVPRVHESYEALIADPDLEAIYNPLPNGLHCAWTLRALAAGKHVLCEKPLGANAEEAERMADAADAAGRRLVEAFHWRYHPLAARLLEIVGSGELGRLRHFEAHFCVPLFRRGDIRFRWDLAGGALMDLGCYTVSVIRHLAGDEPDVVRARARLSSPEVDRYMSAELRFADGRTARLTCSLASAALLRLSARVEGEAGELRVLNPIAPHRFHRLRVRSGRGSRTERVNGASTYTHQLKAFVAAVRDGAELPTDARDAVANMRVIDAIYRAAGLRPRAT